ncbi:hypothetical protein KFV96_26780, partial [Klebsiella pneumoniae]|nr:hypothetical protein [Klebsiella pneumoniae]
MPEADEEFKDSDNIIDIPKMNSGTAFGEEDFEKLKSIENVDSVEKGYNVIAMGANSVSTDHGGCNIIRLATVSSGILESSLSSGNLPKEGEILINKAVADKLGENIIGQKVKLSILIGETKV